MNTSYVYPALFHHNQDDGSYTVTFPDLPGCITEGKDLDEALYMAQSAMSLWLEYSLDHKEPIPAPSALEAVPAEADEFVNLVRADVRNSRAVKRTVSLPKWMDDAASDMGLSLSKVLQDALKTKIGA